MDPVSIRLKRMRESTVPRLSIRRIAEIMEMAPSSYAFYEDPKKYKKRYLPMEFAKALTEPLTAFGIDYWDVLALAGFEEGAIAEINDDRAEGQASVKRKALGDELDLVPLEEIDLEYGMGSTFGDSPVTVQVHQMPRLLMEAMGGLGSASTSLFVAKGRGDSMEPTINNGDMIIVDRSKRQLRDPDRIWALTVGDFHMIKRVRPRGANVVLLSDNPRVPDEIVSAEEVNIVGRVVFIGRKM